MKVPDGWVSGRRWDGTCQSSRVSPIGDSSELDPLGSRSASYYYNLVSAPSGQITTITLRDGAPDRIREYFNHFQSAESTDKRRKVHRSALPEAKCQLHGSGQAISAHFWQGKPVRKNERS